MGRLAIALVALMGCTVITSPGDYEGGDVDGGTTVCMSDDQCPDGVCDMLRGECVDCRVATDCGEGEECDGGLCVPAECGGMVCPDTAPICLANETEEICVECALPGDCDEGETCTASFVCEACAPTEACEADEVCIADDAGDFCLDCDVDGDGLINRDPRCGAVAGELDCDDDADGYCIAGTECLGQCSELAGDCDDADEELVPVVLGCGETAMGCGEPGASIPGDGLGSLSVLEIAPLPAPLDTSVRAPSSVVVEDPSATGTFDVVYLSDGAAGSYGTRNRRFVDADDREVVTGDLPATSLQDFLDLRAKVDLAGTLVGTLGVGTGSLIRSAEVVLAERFEGSTVGAPLVFQDSSAVAPIDVSVESDLATPTPYAVWCSESSAGCDLRYGSPGMPFSDFENAGSPDGMIVLTNRGLAVAGARSDSDLVYWDPRAALEGEESRDAGGTAGLVTGESTLGFDVRFTGGELVARGLSYTTGGYVPSDPESIAVADVDSRVGLFAMLDYGFVALDAPEGDARRILLGRLSDGSGSNIQVSDLLELTGALTPDFSTVYGVEVAARTNGDADEVAVLVHGTLEGADEPALYLFVARRCAP